MGQLSLRNHRGIQAVLFDLDNTLHDRDAAFRGWAERFATERLGHLPASPSFLAQVEWLAERDNKGYGSKPLLFTELQQRYPEQLSDSVEELVVNFHEALIVHTHLETGAAALLQQLASASLPFGIVTNGSARQQRKLEHLGLDRLTECIFISEVFGAGKPEPAIFHAAASHLGVAPDACLFVGDHPVNDIVGAQKVGMQTAWLCRGETWPTALVSTPPDFCLDALSEIDA